MTVFPDGSKERMHGHNFHVGIGLEVPSHEHKQLLDFACVKNALSRLCAELREHLLLPSTSAFLTIRHKDEREVDFELCGMRYVMPSNDVLFLPMDNVIVENLAAWIWKRLACELAEDFSRCEVRVLEVTVTEAPGQGATHSMPFGV